MREYFMRGSVRGVPGNWHSYRVDILKKVRKEKFHCAFAWMTGKPITHGSITLCTPVVNAPPAAGGQRRLSQ